jgi:hypothetical protein
MIWATEVLRQLESTRRWISSACAKWQASIWEGSCDFSQGTVEQYAAFRRTLANTSRLSS